MAPYVVVSCAREDLHYARRLRDWLAECDLGAVVDDGHERDARTTVNAIRSCAAFVVVMTPAAGHDPLVNLQITGARIAGRPVRALLLTGAPLDQMRGEPHEDVTGGVMPTAAFARLLVAPSVFISYRHDDAAGTAQRISDWLAGMLGAYQIFFDNRSIHAGDDFSRETARSIRQSRVVLAIIGRHWLTVKRGGNRRLDLVDDPVRQEIQVALGTRRRIIPVLVDGAAPPTAEALPTVLAPLATLVGVPVREEAFDADMTGLLGNLPVVQQ